MSATNNAEILWAQRSNKFDADKNIIYFTINLPNIIGEPELKIEAQKISFKAQAGAPPNVPEKTYAFDLDLYAEIIPEETKRLQTTRHLALILKKKDAKEEYWPRLTKEKVRIQWIKTDFAKWADEDEQETAAVPDDSEFQGPPGAGGGGPPGGMDMASLMAQMGGAGGAGGAGGMPGMEGLMGGAGGAGGPPGGMDFAKLMAQMQANGGGGAGGMPDFGADDDDEGEDEDDSEMPPLEDAEEPAK